MALTDIAEFTAKKSALEAQRAKMQAEMTSFNKLHDEFVQEIEKVGAELAVPVNGHKYVVVTLEGKLKLAVFTQPAVGKYNVEWEDPVQGVS